jgi:alkanesulfonate monooxygenase SsuD/methylene tetrahydromethanopterin reductase-like flavin-dependent oxidoreductase (luciferase family)
VLFGVQIPQEGVPVQAVLDHAIAAEELGYDSVWVPDHLRGVASAPGTSSFESWTTVTAIAMRTTRVRAGQMVACEAFRNPAWFANALATLDHLCGGRVMLGIGAGWYEDEFRAYGYEWLGGAGRVERMGEALAVITGMWSGEPFEGKHYRSAAPEECPKPVQEPRIPIWVGGIGPKILRETARYADAWNASVQTPEFIAERVELLRGFCEEEGRPMIDVTYEGPVWIDPDADRIARRLEKARGSDNPIVQTYARTAIAGTPEAVAARLKDYEAVGVSHVVCHFGRTDDLRGTELFAKEVIPALRG